MLWWSKDKIRKRAWLWKSIKLNESYSRGPRSFIDTSTTDSAAKFIQECYIVWLKLLERWEQGRDGNMLSMPCLKMFI